MVSLRLVRRAALAAALVGAVALVPAARAAGPAAPKAPADFTMPKAENSPGAVTFSHARHLAKVGKCSTCHMRDFKLKRGASGPITLEAKQEGKFCGACHDGKTMFNGAVVFPIDQCDACHRD